MTEKRKYGFIKSKPDASDLFVKFTDEHVEAFRLKNKTKTKLFFENLVKKKSTLKPVFDLRKKVKLPQALSDINQYSLGSCTSNAIAYAYAFDEIKQSNKEVFLPSRLFIYYNERLMEGTVNEDAGANIRDGIKSINNYGVCMEHLWVYDPAKFAVKPSEEAYKEAKLAKAVKYAQIDFSDDKTIEERANHLKRALLSGYPFVFGFEVYASFESEEVAKTGMVPMPASGEEYLGGHAVCAVGYDDTKQCFIVKNSWGASWGLDGYFYMPYNYTADPKLANEFWVIQRVTNPNNIPNFTPADINPDVVDPNS